MLDMVLRRNSNASLVRGLIYGKHILVSTYKSLAMVCEPPLEAIF